jgi:methylenetetrahydrofolate dehydrogenase (NADP+)/methenyltetrahydrofolate cyclohydrolase
MEKIVRGKDVSLKIKDEIEALKSKLKNQQVKIALVRIGDNGDDIAYENSIIKKFETLEIETEKETFDIKITQNEFVDNLKRINDDNSVNGIIIFRPLPEHINEEIIAQTINPDKDIDGMSYTNIARLFSVDDVGFKPCTPQAVIEFIDYLNLDLTGLDVTIVGAGMAVGQPLSILMINRFATVTTCSKYTKDLVKSCQDADLIVAAAGVKHLIKAEHVKEGAIIIDVGINVEDGKLYGDVDFDNVLTKAKYITPVPGGVGSVTTMILAKQTIKAKMLQETK